MVFSSTNRASQLETVPLSTVRQINVVIRSANQNWIRGANHDYRTVTYRAVPKRPRVLSLLFPTYWPVLQWPAPPSAGELARPTDFDDVP